MCVDQYGIFLWNQTLGLRLVWHLFAGPESLWVAWSKVNRLKGQSFWSHNDDKRVSVTWDSLLSLRPLARSIIRCELGNGNDLSLWYDHWSLLGPLINLFGQFGPNHLGIPKFASVRQDSSTSGWSLRPARSQVAEQLHIFLTIVPFSASQLILDRFLWHTANRISSTHSTKFTWVEVRLHYPL